jgi:hypothetical protein
MDCGMDGARASIPRTVGRRPSVRDRGRPAAKLVAPEGKYGEAEWRKRITALLRNGAPVVVPDNVENGLASSSLSAVLTVVSELAPTGSRCYSNVTRCSHLYRRQGVQENTSAGRVEQPPLGERHHFVPS